MRTKILIIGLFCLSMLGCFGEEKSPSPWLTGQEKQMAIKGIEQHEGVRDAAISQDGDTLSLALIVDYGVTSAKAKELGESFVRLVKSHSKDVAPGQDIGSGMYDYMIGVYYSNNKEVVSGVKISFGENIRW